MADVRKPFVSVIMPAYNESAIIEQSLQRVSSYLASLEHEFEWEVIVIDDGSTDGTGELADQFAARSPGVRVLHHFVNFNLGQALRYAFTHCKGDYVVTIDSDLSYSPEHIGMLLQAIRKTRAKIVIASPYIRGGRTTSVPFVRRIASRGANRFLSQMVKGELATLTSMARVYDRRFLQTLNLKAMDIEINTEIIYKAQVLRAKIVEIPAHLDWSAQVAAGEARKSKLHMARSVMAYAFSGFLFRPVVFFTVPGLLLLCLSLYTLAWVVYHVWGHFVTLEGGLDPRFSQAVAAAFADAPHTFVVGGLSMILAVQLISLGILAVQSKRYFEEVFHLGTTIYRHQQQAEERAGPVTAQPVPAPSPIPELPPLPDLQGVQPQSGHDQPHGDVVVGRDPLPQDVAR